MFTMSVFLLFGYCLTTIIYFAYDPDARFFIGRWPLWGLIWVPLFGLAHWWHVKKAKPVRSVMMACVFGPATTYFIIGWCVLHAATHLHTVLRSSDCSRTAEFKEFNEAALAARKFHNKCLASSQEQLLIHYCPGYEDEKAVDNREETWEYLKYAEHNYGCAGFCNVDGDPSMWTYQGYQDSCAAATANVMRSKIGALAFQMMVYSIIVVVMFLLWIEVMGPTLKALEKHDHHHYHKEEPKQEILYEQPMFIQPSIPPPMPMVVSQAPMVSEIIMPPPPMTVMEPMLVEQVVPTPTMTMGPPIERDYVVVEPPTTMMSMPPSMPMTSMPPSMPLSMPPSMPVVSMPLPAPGSMASMPIAPPTFTSSRLD
jgi:hypothetical protein